MGKEWIDRLAQDIKEKNHEAAENYGREQHKAGIVAARGAAFFAAFVTSLEENINDIRRELQGDVTASETVVQSINPNEVKLTRSRFPWFDARITHQESAIILDYAKGLGVTGDTALDRKHSHFVFDVGDGDALSVKESFANEPKQFHQPEELAEHVTQVLFEV